MNTLIFLAGVGIGTFVSGLIFILVLCTVTRTTKSGKEHMKETGDLLRERNLIDSKIERHLGELAKWAHQNWELR
jgi:hypothetical protein